MNRENKDNVTLACIDALTNENRKALKCLHDTFGFDFEEPLQAVLISGKFTLNSVFSVLNLDKPSNYTVVVMVRDPEDRYTGYRDEYHVVKITPNYVDIGSFRVSWKYNDFNKFCIKKDFEDMRKRHSVYGYIFAQHNDHIKFTDDRVILDRFDRYNISPVSSWSDRIRLTFRDCDGKKYQDIRNNSYTIDHSGYILDARRDELRQRAKELRNKRAQEAYKQRGSDEQIKELGELFQAVKRAIMAEIEAAQTYEQTDKARDKFSCYSWDLHYYEIFKSKAEKREYLSIAFADRAYNELKEKLQALMQK